MANLYQVDSPIDREQRNNLNNTFTDILSRFSSLQMQIKILAGGEEIDALLQRIEDTITKAQNASVDTIAATNDAKAITLEMSQLIDDLIPMMDELEAQLNVLDGKIVEGTKLITDLNALKTDLTTVKVDMVNATIAANTATGKANTATDNANTATSNANMATTKASEATANAIQAKNDAETATTNAIKATNDVSTAINQVKSVGEFVLSTPYKRNNTVLNNGSTWITLQDTQDNPLPVLPIKENAHWRLVAQRGTDGTGSVASVNGALPDVNGNVELTIDKVEVLDELTSTSKSAAVSANKAKELNDRLVTVESISDATITKKGYMTTAYVSKLNSVETGANFTTVVDNLESTSPTSALSAKQGNVISNQIGILTGDLSTTNTNLTILDTKVTQHLDKIDQFVEVRNKNQISLVESVMQNLTFNEISIKNNADFASIDALTNRIRLKKGIYLIMTQLYFGGNISGYREIKIGGATFPNTPVNRGGIIYLTGNVVLRVVSDNSYLENSVFQNSGVTLNIGDIKTSIYKVGDVVD